MKCVQADISCEEVGFGQVRLGKACDAYAQRSMGNGVIVPSHDLSIRHVGSTESRRLKSKSSG
jgi:hypothetical protein